MDLEQVVKAAMDAGYTRHEALQWIVDDPEKLYSDDFKAQAKEALSHTDLQDILDTVGDN